MAFLERADESELEQLTRFARRYHALTSDHGTIIWVMDSAMRPTGPNRAWERYTGQAPAEYTGAGWLEAIHPDDRARCGEVMRDAQGRGAAVTTELAIRRHDGAFRRHVIRAVPVRGEGGSAVEWIGTATDVEDARHTADELRHAEERMAAALAEQRQLRLEAERHSRRMAFLADVSTHLGTLDYEDTLRQVARLAVPHLADWCAVDLIAADGELERLAVAHVDPRKVELALEVHQRYPVRQHDRGVPEVVRSGTAQLHPVITDEMLAGAARDDEHLALLHRLGLQSALIVPLSARGRTFGAITFVAATAGRRFDEDDLALATDLGRRAALAVDNARLFEEAQQANRAKDEFFALLSHELRTPLNAIVGWSQILLSEKQPASALRHGLEVIGRNARVQTRLVEELFDVARLTGGPVPLKVTDVDLREVVRTAAETARPAAVQRDLSLTLVLPSSPCVARVDAPRLQQVLANLLSNAIKFTEPGGEIYASVRGTDNGGEIEVRDTGIGIAPDFLPHVFDRFSQADSSPSRLHGGLGLGLWIVRQFVEAHGGTVHAQSAGAGKGAVFTVYLPRG